MKRLFSFFKISVLFCCFIGAKAQNKLNEIQVIGSHNSYKSGIDLTILDSLAKFQPKWAETLAYGHISIEEQLNLGLRNLELDISVDREGGKYSVPFFYDLFKEKPTFDPENEMKAPGLKVFHIQDIDFRTHCYTLSSCLSQLKNWSNDNPNHTPIFITMNAKDSSNPLLPTKADPFKESDFEALDEQLVRELGRDKLIIPADIQKRFSSLNEAIMKKGWPSLKHTQGKFIFVLDEGEPKRSTYLLSHSPVKTLFINSPEGDSHAAIMIMNNPVRDFEKIKDLVKKGYIIRTRADADTYEARKNDYSVFKAAMGSGAQIITTDYYQKSQYFESDYKVVFPEGGYFRKNPLKD